MTTLEQVQRLIDELGPAHGDIAAVVQNGEAEWAVVFDENEILSLEYDAEQSKLSLSISLGAPAVEKRLEVYQTLLCYSFLRQETGGVAMALAGPEGEAFQMFDLNAHDLSLDRLSTVVDGFMEKARVWRAYVADAGAGAPAFDASTLAMRV